jgi:hypothetical protein
MLARASKLLCQEASRVCTNFSNEQQQLQQQQMQQQKQQQKQSHLHQQQRRETAAAASNVPSSAASPSSSSSLSIVGSVEESIVLDQLHLLGSQLSSMAKVMNLPRARYLSTPRLSGTCSPSS